MFNIYGHRGARGLAPENTLFGYAAALATDVDFIDMDVGMTKDGVLVVTHDGALNPIITRDKSGNWLDHETRLIKNFTFDELQQYDVGRINPASDYKKLFSYQVAMDGAKIPSLKEVIYYVKKNATKKICLQIEIKTNPIFPKNTYSPEEFAKELVKILREENLLAETEVQSFDYRGLLALQKISSDIKTAYLTHQDSKFEMSNEDPAKAGLWSAGFQLKKFDHSIPKMIAHLGGKIWGPQDYELTPFLVEQAHELGLKVVSWSWPEKTGLEFDEQQIKELIKMEVDGIITDRPDLLKNIQQKISLQSA